jgi:hypothetical protein
LSPFLDPLPYGVRVSSGRPTQSRGLPRQGLVEPALAESLEDARDMGQEIGPACGELAQLPRRGAVLILGQLTPASVMPGGAVKLRDLDPVSLRAIIDHAF